LATAGTLPAGDFNAAWEKLPERFKPNSNWLMGYGVADKVAAFGNQQNLSWVTVNLSSTLQQLRTRPVRYSTWMTDLTTSGVHTNCAIIGDLGNFVMPIRTGLNVEPVPLLMDVSTGRPVGARGLFGWARFGSDVLSTSGLRLINQT
jgi:predicted phage gp36 major capsid-like protein